MTKSNSRTTMVKRTEGSKWDGVTTIGIDLSDRISQCCAIDDRGEIVLEFRVATDATTFEKAFREIGRKIIAIETGTHWPWVSRLLESLGHEVIVANSRKLRFIYENRRKDDRVDARSLVKVARMDRKLSKRSVTGASGRRSASNCSERVMCWWPRERGWPITCAVWSSPSANAFRHAGHRLSREKLAT